MQDTAQLFCNPQSNNYWRWQNYCWRMPHLSWPPARLAIYMVAKTEKGGNGCYYSKEFLRTKYLGTLERSRCNGSQLNAIISLIWKTCPTSQELLVWGKSKGLKMTKKVFGPGFKSGKKVRTTLYCFTSFRGSKPQKIFIYFRKISHSRPDPLPEGNGPKVHFQRCLYWLDARDYRVLLVFTWRH